nr:deoxycytidylate deaminase [Hymenolepis microstoma]
MDGDAVGGCSDLIDQLKLFKPQQQAKRTDYLQWDEYFMSLAFLSAMRSKDPNTQVGACIVSQDNKIVAMGYNGMPVGLSDDDIPWTKDKEDVLQNKYLYVCHAELNAVLNKNVLSVKGCRIYTTLFPCHECAKVIIQSGVKEIVYFDDSKVNTPSNNASKIMFLKANVKLTPFVKTGRKINICLS